MKIIISPAKTLSLSKPVIKDIEINSNAMIIINELKKKSTDEIKKILKISDKLLEENIAYIKNFNEKNFYKAIEMYSGTVYKALDYKTLTESAKDYLQENLIILSALYGLIKPLDFIKPYRLDFSSNLKIDGMSLKDYWKNLYNSGIKKGDTVINLASNEFSDLFDKSLFDWYDFDFFEFDGKNKKTHSTIAKKNRGILLREMALNKVKSIEDIKKLKDCGIKFEPKIR